MFGDKADFWTKAHQRLSWDVSRWQRYLFDSRREASKNFNHEIKEVGKTLEEHSTAEEDEDLKKTGVDFSSEIFSRLYGGTEGIEAGPGWAKKVHEMLTDDPSFEVLCESVKNDPDFSALASIQILKVVVKHLPEFLKEEEKKEESSGGEGEGEGSGNSSLGKAGQAMAQALSSASRKASKDADEKRSQMGGIAPGSEFAPVGAAQHSTERLKLAEVISQDRSLKEVIRRAGRIRRLSSSNRFVKSDVARDTVSGLERGGEVSRILPSQLAGLRHPKLRLSTMRDILEKRALQYKYSGTEPLGRGPVVVLLDESGSMNGDPHTWARAIGLACLAMAGKEKRDIRIAGFNVGIRHCHHVDRRGRGMIEYFDRNEKVIKKTKARQIESALSVAGIDCGGGTSFNNAVTWALAHGLQTPKSDLIFVTDGASSVSQKILDALKAAKIEGLQVFGVTVNRGQITESMKAICDEIIDLDSSADKASAASKIRL